MHAHCAIRLGVGVCATLFGWRASHALHSLRCAARLARSASAFTRPPRPGAPTLLVLGDSLALGVGAGHPGESVAGLFARDFPHAGVINAARSGTRTREVPAQFRHLDACGGEVRAIWCSTGGNDILAGTPLHQLGSHIDEVLATSLRHSSTVLVTTTANVGLAPALFFPLDRLLTVRARRVRDLVAERCARAGANFIDFFEEADDDPFSRDPACFFAADGLHPSAATYRACYQRLLRASRLDAAFAPQRHGACRAPFSRTFNSSEDRR